MKTLYNVEAICRKRLGFGAPVRHGLGFAHRVSWRARLKALDLVPLDKLREAMGIT